MAQQAPLWWKSVEAVEFLEDLLAEVAADGEVTLEDHGRVCGFVRSVVLGTVGEAAEAQTYAQAVARNGIGSARALRLLREWEPTPDGDGAAMGAAA
ncbi:MAG: hypothetical protein M3Q74_06200 [Pseudomonadota bacterium]|nr:hypothetical protein [Pseudomonadota bacterium]